MSCETSSQAPAPAENNDIWDQIARGYGVERTQLLQILSDGIERNARHLQSPGAIDALENLCEECRSDIERIEQRIAHTRSQPLDYDILLAYDDDDDGDESEEAECGVERGVWCLDEDDPHGLEEEEGVYRSLALESHQSLDASGDMGERILLGRSSRNLVAGLVRRQLHSFLNGDFNAPGLCQ